MVSQGPPASPFDEATRAALVVMAKRQLRTRLRGLRQAVPGPALAARSAKLVERVQALEAYRRASTVASYFPMEGRGEVDLRPLHEAGRSDGKDFYYPFIEPDLVEPRLGFRRVGALEEMEERGRGFAEPRIGAEEAPPSGLDLILVPALAVDGVGRRLGQGSGFYDRLLPRFRPPALAVAVIFDFQLLGELPGASHDARCDLVVTDTRLLDFRRAP